MWSSSTGGDGGSIAYAAIGPETGEFSLATSGSVCAVQVRDRAHRTLRGSATPLGFDPDLEVTSTDRDMARGDLLVLLSSGVLAARDSQGNPITSSAVAKAARSAKGKPEQVIGAVRQLLDNRFPYGGASDRTILVVRRR
jgi:serine phosphatase RsbU (regulator of sigma subunit)